MCENRGPLNIDPKIVGFPYDKDPDKARLPFREGALGSPVHRDLRRLPNHLAIFAYTEGPGKAQNPTKIRGHAFLSCFYQMGWACCWDFA